MAADRPTFERPQPFAVSECLIADEYFRSIGLEMDAAQLHQMEAYLARDENGDFAATTVATSEPRQNGKSFAARLYAIWCSLVCGLTVLYSTHTTDCADDFFGMLLSLFDNPDEFPELYAEVEEIVRQPGRQKIVFRNGGFIKFRTRTTSGARGGTFAVAIIDEAQELTESQWAAILPATSAAQCSANQIVFVGTPPDPSCRGTVFRDFRDRVLAGGSEIWWMEWGVQAFPRRDSTVDELVALAATCNPAFGVRISERTVRNEAATMSLDTFARERLGWWDKAAVNHVIDSARWDACATDAPPMDGTVCYAVKFSSDGACGAIAVCLKPRGGTTHVELVDDRSMSGGTGYFASWLQARAGRAAQIVVDGKSNAQPLVDKLIDAGVPKSEIIVPKTDQVVAACSSLVDAVDSGDLTHYAQPALDDAALNAQKRPIGSGGGYGFTSYALESVALARWAACTTRRDPARKQRVGF